jgi:sporulation protein YlmC with PRC-barrel domain
LIGSTVYDVQNEKIGSVQDIVLNKDGRVTAVVVDVGTFLGMGGKDVAVSLNDLKMNNDRLTLDRSKDQLKSAPTYQLSSNQ